MKIEYRKSADKKNLHHETSWKTKVNIRRPVNLKT